MFMKRFKVFDFIPVKKTYNGFVFYLLLTLSHGFLANRLFFLNWLYQNWHLRKKMQRIK